MQLLEIQVQEAVKQKKEKKLLVFWTNNISKIIMEVFRRELIRHKWMKTKVVQWIEQIICRTQLPKREHCNKTIITITLDNRLAYIFLVSLPLFRTKVWHLKEQQAIKQVRFKNKIQKKERVTADYKTCQHWRIKENQLLKL